jgi:hypothetical protein
VRKAEGKFWLCADFPVARPVLSEDGPAEAPPKDPVASYIETLPPYQKTAVAAMPRAKQMQYVANRVEFEDWRKRAMAEAVALVREKTEPVGDRINVAFKVPVLRAEKKPHTQTFIQLELFGEPLLNLSKLAIFDGQRVNGHAQSSAVLNPNGTAPPSTAPSARPADPHPPMPTGASVGAESSDRAPRTRAESAPPPGLVSQPRPRALTAEQLGPIDAAMRQVCSPASRDVNLLFGHCRDFAPDCTPEEVAHFVRQTVIKAKRNRVENWIGFLLRGVPPNFESPGFEAWRVQRQDSEMVTLPGFSSMPRAEAIALLREYEHAEEQDVRSFAREHLVKLLGITEVA